MSAATGQAEGPDFTEGIELASVSEGEILRGHVDGEPAILIKHGDEAFALGAFCTHYGAPLADGLVAGDTVRCPWHHACFSMQTGEPLRPPALDPLQRWRVQIREGVAFAAEKLQRMDRRTMPEADALASIVIVGGGAAGYVAVSTLRHEGYTGLITMLSADAALPCDRPNLSKGYLAGSASYESNLLRPASFYDTHGIDVRLNSRVASIDVAGRYVETTDHNRYGFDALLLATGAEPVRLDIPGGDRPHVHYLRTVADSRAIVSAAQSAHRAVVIGASFIGMEVASSLRARDIEVHVVAPDAVPMEKVLGPDVGRFLRGVHEKHGVTFHLGTTVSEIGERSVRLESGETIDADLVVVGIGVRPATKLAQEAGLEIDRGVLVDAFLETSAPGIFAAGDIARWPDPLSGERIRIEHFVVAERQGQAAARNMLGGRERFAAVPFFWTEQFDVGLAYVGHAEGWDEARIEGDLEAHDATITYCREGRKLAVAVVHRDFAGLRAEVEFERSILADADDPAGEHHTRRQEAV